MKPFLIALLLCALTVGCAPQKPGAAAEAPLRGGLEAGAYRNHYFGFKIDLPEGWEVASEEKQQSLARELQAAHAQRPEVQFMLYREVEGAAIPDVFLIAAEPYPNPTISGLDDAFAFFRRGEGEGSEVLRRAHAADIGGVRFAREDVLHRGGGQYMAHHALAIRGQLLSLQVHSTTRRRMEEAAREITSAIEFTR